MHLRIDGSNITSRRAFKYSRASQFDMEVVEENTDVRIIDNPEAYTQN